MPRRSARFEISSASTTPRGNKRSLETSPPGRSTSTRTKNPRSTTKLPAGGGKRGNSNPKRSKYFARDSSAEEIASDAQGTASASDGDSVYSGSGAVASETESNADDTEYDEHGSEKGTKTVAIRGRRNTKDAAPSLAAGNKDLWREGVRTGLGPGKEVFIALPRARSPGGIPYEDSTIHPNTMLFLKELKANNEREWMKLHDKDFRVSKTDWDTFVESVTAKLMEKDVTIPELPAKDLVFRIYRDVRFSKEKTPYKPHFSAAWSRTGRKGKYAAYYLHLEPGKCFLAAGLWMPEPHELGLLRADVDQNPESIKGVLNAADLRREFLKGIPADEKKAVKAFVSQNQESALKTKPKGWDADHRDIALLRLRSYTLSKPIPDDTLLGQGAPDRVAHLMGILVPFVTYLNSIVMPDDPDESADSDEDENDDDDDAEDEP